MGNKSEKLEGWQARLVGEYDDVKRKERRLDEFINRDAQFYALTKYERRQMCVQQAGMRMYKQALYQRLLLHHLTCYIEEGKP